MLKEQFVLENVNWIKSLKDSGLLADSQFKFFLESL